MPEILSSKELREMREACDLYIYYSVETHALRALLDAYEQAHGGTSPPPPRAASQTEMLIDRYLSEATRVGDVPVRITLSLDRYDAILSSAYFNPLTATYRGIPVAHELGVDTIRIECATNPS